MISITRNNKQLNQNTHKHTCIPEIFSRLFWYNNTLEDKSGMCDQVLNWTKNLFIYLYLYLCKK